MRRSRLPPAKAITGWKMVLLLPLVLPLALVSLFWPKGRGAGYRAQDVADILRDFIEGTGGDWHWDEFENTRLADPALETLRQRAIMAGPPEVDLDVLRGLLAEAEVLASEAALIPGCSPSGGAVGEAD